MQWHLVRLLVLLFFLYCTVNYTGSIGFGDSSIEALEGQIGIRDVEDCYVTKSDK